MSLTALYYLCSIWIYYNVYHLKINEIIQRLSKGHNCKTYRKVARTSKMAKNVTRVKKKDN